MLNHSAHYALALTCQIFGKQKTEKQSLFVDDMNTHSEDCIGSRERSLELLH